jgi:hypothetical protein
MDEVQYKLIESLAKGATEGMISAGGDLAKQAATSAWGKLKSVFRWKTDPKPEEVVALAKKAVADNTALAGDVQTILNDYRQQVGGISIGTINAKNVIAGASNTFNGPTTFN